MSPSINRVRTELRSLGYETEVFESEQGVVVAFEYTIEAGSHKGKTVIVGVSFQGGESYPEYAPHWVHVTPPISDNQGGAVRNYSDDHGRQWFAMSRPPGKWDQFRTKHMSVYISEHLRRIWSDI